MLTLAVCWLEKVENRQDDKPQPVRRNISNIIMSWASFCVILSKSQDPPAEALQKGMVFVCVLVYYKVFKLKHIIEIFEL